MLVVFVLDYDMLMKSVYYFVFKHFLMIKKIDVKYLFNTWQLMDGCNISVGLLNLSHHFY